MRKAYVRVKLPEELTDYVAQVANKRLLGYRSMIEFTSAAVRREVKDLIRLGVLPPFVPKVKTIPAGAIGVLSAVLLVAAVALLGLLPPATTGLVFEDVFEPLAGWNFPATYERYSGFINFTLYLVIFFAIVYAATRQRFEKREATVLAAAFAVALSIALSLVKGNWMRQLSPLVFVIVILALLYAVFEGLRMFGFRWVSPGSLAYILAYLLVRTHRPDVFRQAGTFGAYLNLALFIAFAIAFFKLCSQLWAKSEPVLAEARHQARLAWGDTFGTPEQKDMILREQAAITELLKIQPEEFKRVAQLQKDLSTAEKAVRKYGYSREALATIAHELGKLRGRQTELAQRIHAMQDTAQRLRAVDVELFTKMKRAYDKLSDDQQAKVKKAIEERVAELQLDAALPRLAETAAEIQAQLDATLRDSGILLEKNNAPEALRAIEKARYQAEQLRGILGQVEDTEKAIQTLAGRTLRWFQK